MLFFHVAYCYCWCGFESGVSASKNKISLILGRHFFKWVRCVILGNERFASSHKEICYGFQALCLYELLSSSGVTSEYYSVSWCKSRETIQIWLWMIKCDIRFRSEISNVHMWRWDGRFISYRKEQQHWIFPKHDHSDNMNIQLPSFNRTGGPLTLERKYYSWKSCCAIVGQWVGMQRLHDGVNKR